MRAGLEVVTGCFNQCSFYSSDMDGMKCTHPFFKNKGAYENMIITQSNSRDGKVPEKCPLRSGAIKISTTVRLGLHVK